MFRYRHSNTVKLVKIKGNCETKSPLRLPTYEYHSSRVKYLDIIIIIIEVLSKESRSFVIPLGHGVWDVAVNYLL